jgi:hypothetical protein
MTQEVPKMSKGYKYYNPEKQKWVHGNAALLHVISEDGGLEAHYHKIVTAAIRNLIDEVNDEMTRPRLRVVNGGA